MEIELDLLSDRTNRSLRQTKMLFELCDKDFSKLNLLETVIKNNHLFYCPADKETVDYVLSLNNLKP